MKRALYFVLLVFGFIPQTGLAETDFKEIARNVTENKRAFFTELAKTFPEEGRTQKYLKIVLAREVICGTQSAYGEKVCATLKDMEARTLGGFPHIEPNIRIVLRGMAAMLRGAKISLSSRSADLADEILLVLGWLLTKEGLGKEDLNAVLRKMENKNELWAEFESPALQAYSALISELNIWFRAKSVEPPSLPHSSAKYGVLCTIEGKELRCVGDNRDGLANAPAMSNPRTVSVGSDTACAIDGAELKCWGRPGSEVLTKMPRDLQNPTRVEVYSKWACAIDEIGLHCWGSDKVRLPQWNFDDSEITDLSFDLKGLCVLSNGKLLCANDSEWIQPEGLPLKNPRQLTTRAVPCLVDDHGPRCWTLTNVNNKVKLQPLELPFEGTEPVSAVAVLKGESWEPIKAACALNASEMVCHKQNGTVATFPIYGIDSHSRITFALGSFCAEGGGRLRCFEGEAPHYLAPRSIKSVSQIDIASNCALAAGKVKCWGAEAEGLEKGFALISPPIQAFSVSRSRIDQNKSRLIAFDGMNLIGIDLNENVPREIWRKKLEGEFRYLAITRGQYYPIDPNGNMVACAGGERGMKCWWEKPGSSVSEFPLPPELAQEIQNPQQQLLFGNDSCVIDQDQVKCWNFRGGRVSRFRSSTSLSFQNVELFDFSPELGSEIQPCALDDEGAKCWDMTRSSDYPDRRLEVFVSKLNLPNAKKIVSGSGFLCGLVPHEVRCWTHVGESSIHPPPKSRPIPPLKNPYLLEKHENKICAADEDGIRCWTY